jgi:hypothetical protein
MEKVFIDSSYARVTVDTEQKLGKIVWKGTCTFEQYQECFTALLDYQAKNTVKYYISDIRKQGVMNPKNRQWFESEALPRAIKQGLLKGAVIMEANIFKRYYINLILQATNKMGLPLRIFESEEEAVKWLLQ